MRNIQFLTSLFFTESLYIDCWLISERQFFVMSILGISNTAILRICWSSLCDLELSRFYCIFYFHLFFLRMGEGIVKNVCNCQSLSRNKCTQHALFAFLSVNFSHCQEQLSSSKPQLNCCLLQLQVSLIPFCLVKFYLLTKRQKPELNQNENICRWQI